MNEIQQTNYIHEINKISSLNQASSKPSLHLFRRYHHLFISLAIFLFFILLALPYVAHADDSLNIPILCYHNLNPTKPGSMNLTPAKFESQLKWLKDNGYHVVPLKEVVEYLQGKRPSLPEKSVVITLDDGWQSAYQYAWPIIRKYQYPVTFFIYPQTISVGKNAMTWDELKELQKTGLVDIQGHTYWHPNFKQEKRKMSAENYAKFVKSQLGDSKKILEEKLGTKVTLLAWPFGIYDSYLEQEAANAGYEMAFSIDALPANKRFRPMAQPRYMIVDGLSEKTFIGIIGTANKKDNHHPGTTTPATKTTSQTNPMQKVSMLKGQADGR